MNGPFPDNKSAGRTKDEMHRLQTQGSRQTGKKKYDFFHSYRVQVILHICQSIFLAQKRKIDFFCHYNTLGGRREKRSKIVENATVYFPSFIASPE